MSDVKKFGDEVQRAGKDGFDADQSWFLNVRFGSLADISEGITDVRFIPESGHAERQNGRALSANSRHYGSGGRRRDPPSRRKLGLKQLRVQGPVKRGKE